MREYKDLNANRTFNQLRASLSQAVREDCDEIKDTIYKRSALLNVLPINLDMLIPPITMEKLVAIDRFNTMIIRIPAHNVAKIMRQLEHAKRDREKALMLNGRQFQ